MLLGLSAQDELQKICYIEKFARFIEWPAANSVESSRYFVIKVYGSPNEFKIIERYFSNQQIMGKRILLFEAKTINEINNCHLLYITNSSSLNLKNEIAKAAKQSIFVVASGSEANEMGAMISFLHSPEGIVFKVNRKASSLAGFYIRYHLLSLNQVTY